MILYGFQITPEFIGTTKTLRVVGILLVLFFLFCASALLPQPVGAINTATVTVGNSPEGVAVTPNGEFAYVANLGGTTVSVINTPSNTVKATVTVGNGPVGVAVTPNGENAYVANYRGGTVSVISTASNTVTATVTVGSNPVGVAVTPNGIFVYVTNAGDNAVSLIGTTTASPSPTVPEFPAQLLGITLVVFMIIIFSVVAIRKKKISRAH